LEFQEKGGATFGPQQAASLNGADVDGGIDTGRLSSAEAPCPALRDAEGLGGSVQTSLKTKVGNPPLDNLTANASRVIGTLCRRH
jgi:hypothetical protein